MAVRCADNADARVSAPKRTIEALLFAGAAAVVTLSAIMTKDAVVASRQIPALTQIVPTDHSPRDASPRDNAPQMVMASYHTPAPAPAVESFQAPAAIPTADAPTAETRWFDARPVRTARVVMMTVTAYSPDSRSCGEFADGQTATLHSVWTNGMRLVAADPKVFKYGTMLSIPGYADDSVVPVLDCGGAIKGLRLDVMMPTHEQARAWGVRKVPVTVWEYADGDPAPNPREVR
ncbi:MAG: 3D domain-containing protein [Phycisphaerales bacterium]